MYKPLTETNAYYAGITAGAYLNPPNDATEAEKDESRDAAKAVYIAWRSGVVTTEELARETVRLIAEDVDAGIVPWDVRDFSALHDYVDANCYSLEIVGYYIDETDNDQNYDLINAVQDRVNEMLCGHKVPGFPSFADDNRPLADARASEYHRALAMYDLLLGPVER